MTKGNGNIDGTRAEIPIVIAPEAKSKQGVAQLAQAVATLVLVAVVACVLLTGAGVWLKLFWIGWVFAR